MAKVTPKIDVRVYPVVTQKRDEVQTGVSLELSNVEAHVIARTIGLVGGYYNHNDAGALRTILNDIWEQLRLAGYCTDAHVEDGRRFFTDGSRMTTVTDVRPIDIAPKAVK